MNISHIIPKSTFKSWNKILNRKRVKPEDEDQCLKTITVETPNNQVVDIKLCAGQHNYFVDIVLFEERNGALTEICCDIADELEDTIIIDECEIRLKEAV